MLESIEEHEVEAYLGAVDYPQSSTWTEILTINGNQLRFKVDTGASVTAIPEPEYTKDRTCWFMLVIFILFWFIVLTAALSDIWFDLVPLHKSLDP
ncbi:hypothetical protein GBF38_012642 [Nibea albiflora]|uniref:Uncharacterized protein n=1 Tax=Nibea albiflora TaxID=240163 RepID=A0ACB7EYG7_NIBAL|nr:hypothetical protein GBF38_012642 [Nibea albiflora]